MEIKLTIPTAKAQGFRDYLCGKFGYRETITDPDDSEKNIPNPETKPAFCKRQIIEMLKRDYRSWIASEAREAARLSALEDADTMEIS